MFLFNTSAVPAMLFAIKPRHVLMQVCGTRYPFNTQVYSWLCFVSESATNFCTAENSCYHVLMFICVDGLLFVLGNSS